jgi:hypothetical protein
MRKILYSVGRELQLVKFWQRSDFQGLVNQPGGQGFAVARFIRCLCPEVERQGFARRFGYA